MSRGESGGPPTYVFIDANDSSDRPQLSRNLVSAWDVGPSTSNTSTHRPAVASRADRRYGNRAVLMNSAYYEIDTRMEDSPNGHSNDPFPLRARRSFYIPEYLQNTRYARRLRQQHEKELVEQQEQARRSSTGQSTGLPTSSSSTSLSRTAGISSGLASMHRGVAQKVIERFPELSDSDSKVAPLPTRWNDDDKSPGLEISGGGLELRFSGHFKTVDEAASLRTDHPIPREAGLFYFEVQLRSKGKDGLIGLGLSRRSTNLARQPGWESESFAYHGDDGSVYSGSSSGHAYGPKYSVGDIVGCGVNFRTNCIFFTRNGVNLGAAFKDVKTDRLYPTVGLRRSGENLRLNLGRKQFVFDIEGMMRQEQAVVKAMVLEQDTANLHPPDDERMLIRKLIGQFLVHEGYVETSKAFAQDIRALQALAPSEKGLAVHTHDEADDVHAVHRQKIRVAVLEGSIDTALKFMRTYYPRVLEDKQNRDIFFRLRCRRFIEMMREYADASTQPESNGHSVQDNTQMELDQQLQREASNGHEEVLSGDVDMDSHGASQRPAGLGQGDLLDAAIIYGQGLRVEFSTEAQTQVLDDIFALMAYPDPRDSPVGGLLDTGGRASIAEDLNGAILVSLGKPASAALEKVCVQTTKFLDLAASRAVGAAAFIDVESDLLDEE